MSWLEGGVFFGSQARDFLLRLAHLFRVLNIAFSRLVHKLRISVFGCCVLAYMLYAERDRL